MLRSDVILKQDVIAELARDPICRGVAVDVNVHSGIVALTGVVQDDATRHAIRCAAKRVYGVDGVDEHLQIAGAVHTMTSTAGAHVNT